MKDATLALHHGFQNDPTTKAVAVPIYQTVAYEFDNAQHGADLFNLAVPGNIYTRIMNPTNDVLEQRLAALEGGIAGLVVSAGSAAIHYAILTLAQAGDNIVSTPQLYGGTYTLFAHMLPSLGIEVRFAADDSPAAIAKLIDGNTKAVYAESIGNPAGNIVDIAAFADAGADNLTVHVEAGPHIHRTLQAIRAAGMKAGLADLKNATLKAKAEVPGGLKDQAADSPARKTYTEGLDNVIKQVDDANALIDAGKLDEAKAAIKEINTTRKTYHKKLGV